MIKCNVEWLDKAIRDGHKNIQRFGGLFLDMYASNVARGMCFNATLPLGKNRKSKVAGRKSGEGSASRDIARAVGAPGKAYRMFKERDPVMARPVYAMLRQKKEQEAQQVAFDSGVPVTFYASFTKRMHKDARRRGTVDAFSGRVTSDSRGLKKYRMEVFKHIGKAKSGWTWPTSYGWQATGRLPQWITRHGLNGIYRRTGDSVEIINPVPYAKEAMIERLFPLVYSHALTATNLKLHHEWKRINKS